VSPDPRRRLEAFIQEWMGHRESLARFGCPMGTLCAELHKEGGPLAEHSSKLFDELLTWLEEQFRLAGSGRESRDLAVQVLSAVQGAGVLAQAFHNPPYVVREGNELRRGQRAGPARQAAARSREHGRLKLVLGRWRHLNNFSSIFLRVRVEVGK